MRVYLAVIAVLGGSLALAQSYDYIIVGAGTAGLVVANRLSEDPSVNVVVVEPGTDERDNLHIKGTDQFAQAFDTRLDWNYTTIPQVHAGGRSVTLHQGRVWGGTSAINGMAYVRGNRAEFDVWEGLGNPGWNWDTMLPYFKKSEKYFIPREDQLAAGASYEPQHHGFKGPLHVGLAPAFTNTSASPRLHAAWESLSVPRNPDFNSGSVRGYSYPPSTLDPTLNVRYDSSRAYIHPVEHRLNLQILQGTVKRITWAPQPRKQTKCQGRGLVANGVEYLTEAGEMKTIRATKEVVVSAGAIRTPGVLEGSGVGNPQILKALGIETKIDLPGVGENLLEQPHHTLVYDGNLEESTNAFYTYLTAENLFGDRLAAVEASSRARIPEFARASVNASGDGALNVTVIEKLFTIQHDLMFKKNATIAEILTIIAVGLQFSDYWILFPFSRGSVHLSSKESIDKPLFDPRLMLADFDVQTTVAAGRLAKKFWQSEPVAASVGGQVLPDAATLPDDATDAQWETWARNNAVPNAHPIGTASMMSRELGGVVDPELKVYGTANVRVVDASVMPIQTSGHLTSTIYALAERLSDIIKHTA
ncbi:hypothetical protein D7B24_006453 [Verticillium nonalfalfae]|uniref:Glucose-methanol-choline oxidoreductase N-terminal domain-containing protein n=1 Tax=Verticillium nonalfalfae TaxID=1051616 RepID=A0A3M9Y9V0_9PEZI|nr:uncharacterized protein D7B24_006453 [Verticillium nonalfalfae]RNJ57061.1 hypothetical protein D7B24_006453 [Verticillium nonalfalfae]